MYSTNSYNYPADEYYCMQKCSTIGKIVLLQSREYYAYGVSTKHACMPKPIMHEGGNIETWEWPGDEAMKEVH